MPISPAAAQSGVAPAYAENEAELKKRAERGEAEAQHWLGVAYLSATFGPQQPKEALKWMTKSAKSGFGAAARMLAHLHRLGLPVGLTREEVTGLLRNSAILGDPDCQVDVAVILGASADPSQQADARDFLQKALRAGHPGAQVLQGDWWRLGTAGTRRDPRRAAEVYLKAAKGAGPNARSGNAFAAEGLALLYLEGGDVRVDLQRAELWLRRAAYRGKPSSLALLALLLAFHPAAEHRSLQEALILAREAETIDQSDSAPEVILALASVLYAHGQTEDAIHTLRRLRNPQAKGYGLPEYSTTTLDAYEAEWKKPGSTWIPPLLRAQSSGDFIPDDTINAEESFFRIWQPPAVSGIDDPLPLYESIQPPPFEHPTWQGRELPINDWGEPVKLPTLIPPEKMVLSGFAVQGAELLERAGKGNRDAHLELALRMIYLVPNPITKKDGIALLHEVAASGYPSAIRCLGMLYSQGAHVQRDEDSAYSLFHEAAQAGDAEAMFQVARCSEFGIGTPPNARDASTSLRRAVVHGHLGAHDLLAVKLLEGRGARLDIDAAVNLLYKAAGSGYPESQFRLAILHQSDRWVTRSAKDAFFWASRAATQGHERAQFLLGQLLLRGDGCEADPLTAATWTLTSAQAFFIPAIRQMADFYQEGTVLPQDAPRSEAWLRRAVHIGDALDKLRLAEFLAGGIPGSVRQPKEAAVLLEKALADPKDLASASKAAFLLRAASVSAALEKWNDALDHERAYLIAISQRPFNQTLEFQELRRASLARQEAFIEGKFPQHPSPPSNPAVKHLPADTILQEDSDKAKPEKPLSPKGPSWDLPWSMEV